MHLEDTKVKEKLNFPQAFQPKAIAGWDWGRTKRKKLLQTQSWVSEVAGQAVFYKVVPTARSEIEKFLQVIH